MRKIIFFSLISVLFFSSQQLFAQIESGKVTSSQEVIKPKKEKKPKKERIPRTEEDVKGAPFIFIGSGIFYNDIINKEVNTLYSRPLGIKKDEKGRVIPIANISYKAHLSKGFYFNFGFDYSQSGEKFNWKDDNSDSTLAYKNNYHLLSLPLGVNYIYGKKVQLIAGLGIAPNLTFGAKNITDITTTAKEKSTVKTQIQDRMNDFNVMGYVQIGVQFKLGTGIYFYILPEARYSFANTLNKQATYQRKFWQIGTQIGVSINL